MIEERMIRHGLIRGKGGELQLCSDLADIPGMELVWVPESLAAKQARTLHNYHEFQAELATYAPEAV